MFIRWEEIRCAAQGAAIIVTTAAVSIYKEEDPAGLAKGTAFASTAAAAIPICQIGVQELADRGLSLRAYVSDKSLLTTTDCGAIGRFAAGRMAKRL